MEIDLAARVAVATEIGNKVLATTDIWQAVGELTEKLGAKVGRHLEDMLLKNERAQRHANSMD